MKTARPFICVFLLLSSIMLLALSQPSLLFEDGLSFCAWIAFVPLFLLLERASARSAFLWGALYGALAYFCLCWWLSAFGAVAISFVCALYAAYYAVLFFLIVWSQNVFPPRFARFFWIFRVFILLSFDVLRTRGIFAFSYGIIGYSQWKSLAFLHFSSLFGVNGVSFLILLCNSLLTKVISERNLWQNVKSLSVVLSLLLAVFISGFFSSVYSAEERTDGSLHVALIQNASSAPSRTIFDYQNDVRLLKRLTDEALRFHPETELVVWGETAVVPDILYYMGSGTDARRHELARDVLEYIRGKDCAFLIGNNHRDGTGEHNAALYFSPDSEAVGVYCKNHLVPFTEFWPDFLDFPIFDGIKASLNCEFFAPGSGGSVFSISTASRSSLNFAVPICFEDSFAPLVSEMKRCGADFFVNISDDAWAKSPAAQKMHLSMSAFRCAEFASPMIRATIDGKTCIISSSGNVLSEIASGADSFLCGEMPVPQSSGTLYARVGDAPFILLCALTALFLLILSARFVTVRAYGRR